MKKFSKMWYNIYIDNKMKNEKIKINKTVGWLIDNLCECDWDENLDKEVCCKCCRLLINEGLVKDPDDIN